MKALKILKAIFEQPKEYDTTGFKKSYIHEAIAELEAPKTCDGCEFFRPGDKACFKSSVNLYIRPASIHFSGCGEYEPKESL